MFMNIMYGVAAIGGMATFIGSIVGLFVMIIKKELEEIKERIKIK